jgi:hypothetical protein
VQQRFLVKSEAKAKGEDEPDVAFEKRLAAMKREAKAKLKVHVLRLPRFLAISGPMGMVPTLVLGTGAALGSVSSLAFSNYFVRCIVQ